MKFIKFYSDGFCLPWLKMNPTQGTFVRIHCYKKYKGFGIFFSKQFDDWRIVTLGFFWT
jgi:hypothetical protein